MDAALDPTDKTDERNSDAVFIRIEIGLCKFNLILVHLRSKLRGEKLDQIEKLRNVNSRIRVFERQYDENTVVVGDFNLDPFDEGLVMAAGFHAMMDRGLVSPKGRIVNGIRHPFFYNPMWKLYGSRTETSLPPGTYYYDKSENLRYYWHLFDQVLIRPGLLANFRDLDLEVIDHDGRSSLRAEGKPNANLFSDHLPIFFKLNF